MCKITYKLLIEICLAQNWGAFKIDDFLTKTRRSILLQIISLLRPLLLEYSLKELTIYILKRQLKSKFHKMHISYIYEEIF